jgi:hypothetical protein
MIAIPQGRHMVASKHLAALAGLAMWTYWGFPAKSVSLQCLKLQRLNGDSIVHIGLGLERALGFFAPRLCSEQRDQISSELEGKHLSMHH